MTNFVRHISSSMFAGAIALVLVALLGVLALAAVAGADVGHPFSSSFGDALSVDMLRGPGVVAVDHATGDVFVADPGGGVVDVFNASGEYLTRFGVDLEAAGLAVDEATGVVYAAEPVEGVVLAFAPDGSGGYVLASRWSGEHVPGGAFGAGEVLGVAVDNSMSLSDPSAGDVYVVDSEGAPVNKGESQHAAAEVFKPGLDGQEGAFVRNVVGKGLDEPSDVAVDSATGRVYVADSESGVIEAFGDAGVYEAKLKGAGSPIGSLEEGGVAALAVDEATGDLLVAEEEDDVISELNSSGEWVGWITGTPAGPFGEVHGVGVTGSGDVLVPDAVLGVVDVFGPGVNVPHLTIKAPTKITGTTATLRGTVDGEGETASYHFEVGENEGYGAPGTPDAHTVGGGEESVQAALTGLKPASTYYVRLVAENVDGMNCSVGITFATEGGTGGGLRAESISCARPKAEVESESATQVATDHAALQAKVNPHGHQSTAYFQYGTESCSVSPEACVNVPQPPVEVGAGENPVTVSAVLDDLQPDTTYHYRAIASNSLGTSDGREQTFHTNTAQLPALPDGRAWEMVTPPNKHGAPIEALPREGGVILAAANGDALTYIANGAIEEEVQGNRSFEPQQTLAVRGPQGWASQDIATANARGAGANFGAPEYQFFSPDLSLALVEPYVPEPALAPGAVGKVVYLRDDQPIAPEPPESQSYSEAHANDSLFAPGFLPLVSERNTVDAGSTSSVTFLAATPDLAHVVLNSSGALLGASSGGGLYEWSQGGSLQFVSVLPNGEAASASSVALGYYRVRAHAVSGDGTRVIWTASQELPAHLYMRDTSTETTVQLDVAEAGLGEPQGAARFQTASSGGSRVFFTDDQALVRGASVEPAREVSDLYECELVEEGGEPRCVLRDLTIPLRMGEHAAVQGQVLGASEDGTSVYLVAKGVLAANENAHGEVALPNHENLYELHSTGTEWQRTFIAGLSGEDAPDWDQGPNVSDENMAFQTARVSPNGRYLTFMSQQSLTGYDNEDVSSQQPGERLDQEVYLYDSHTGALTCASCDPSGARPAGVLDQEKSGEGIGLVVDRRESWRGHWLAGSIPGWTSESLTNALYQSRYLSDEGRLFFDAADPLVPGVAAPLREEQIDGHAQQVGVENVYEYEPAGDGSCDMPGGCVGLLSSGSSHNESAFLEAAPSGNDVFLLTTSQLLPQDTDDAFDIYDARVCTSGSPCLAPPQSPPSQCQTLEDCHSPGALTPTGITATGSATFSGQGNLPHTTATPEQQVKGVKTTVPKPLTRAQKLALALKACKKHYGHSRKKRQACEAHAKKLYGTHKKTDTHKNAGRKP